VLEIGNGRVTPEVLVAPRVTLTEPRMREETENMVICFILPIVRGDVNLTEATYPLFNLRGRQRFIRR